MSEMFDPEDAEHARRVPLEDSELEDAAGGHHVPEPPDDLDLS